MARHAGKDKKVDMDELREILTEVHGGTPPLPKDLLWCMAEGDQDRSGYLQQGELFVVLNRYKKYTDDQPNMVDLIKKHDKNGDMKLDQDEMKMLLQEACGVTGVTEADVKIVNKYFKQALKENPDKSVKGIDPDALAKAISRWDDEKNLSEGMFAGLMEGSLLDGPSLPNFDPQKSLNDVGGFFSSLACCCGGPDTDRPKSFKRSSSSFKRSSGSFAKKQPSSGSFKRASTTPPKL